MTYLDFDRIKEPRRASDQRSSWHGELRYRVEASFVEYPGPVGDALPALQVLSDGWVVLPPLELLVRVEVWISVVQTHHHADQHQLLTGNRNGRGSG